LVVADVDTVVVEVVVLGHCFLGLNHGFALDPDLNCSVGVQDVHTEVAVVEVVVQLVACIPEGTVVVEVEEVYTLVAFAVVVAAAYELVEVKVGHRTVVVGELAVAEVEHEVETVGEEPLVVVCSVFDD
jgi:hypothetical protein